MAVSYTVIPRNELIAKQVEEAAWGTDSLVPFISSSRDTDFLKTKAYHLLEFYAQSKISFPLHKSLWQHQSSETCPQCSLASTVVTCIRWQIWSSDWEVVIVSEHWLICMLWEERLQAVSSMLGYFVFFPEDMLKCYPNSFIHCQ